MKHAIFLLSMFVCVGCGGTTQDQSVHPTQNQAVESPDSAPIHSASAPAEPMTLGRVFDPPIQLELPDGFWLDSFPVMDTARNLAELVVLPRNGKSLDQTMEREISKCKKSYLKGLDERIADDARILTTVNSEFQAFPVSVYQDEALTSILFVIYEYAAGAVHGWQQHQSFNFDSKSGQRLPFASIFAISTASDRDSLQTLIKKAVKNPKEKLPKLENIDFNFENDSISFNFDDYEIGCYAEGAIRGKVAKQRLAPWLRPRFR